MSINGLGNPKEAINYNADMLRKQAANYTAAAVIQLAANSSNPDTTIQESSKTVAETMFFIGLTLGVSAEAIKTDTWESLRDILATFAKENFPDFPDLPNFNPTKKEDFPSIISDKES